MGDIAARYRKVAATFTDRARAVPGRAWENPSPCEGWVARDIVRHLVEWVPPFLADGAQVELATGPPVDDDPVGAWQALNEGIQALLDDPAAAASQFSHHRAGTHRLEDAIATFILGDVLMHTWDLARATGLDETLDADEARAILAALEPLGDTLSQSGQYGARVTVPADADDQTKLIAFTGRQP